MRNALMKRRIVSQTQNTNTDIGKELERRRALGNSKPCLTYILLFSETALKNCSPPQEHPETRNNSMEPRNGDDDIVVHSDQLLKH